MVSNVTTNNRQRDIGTGVTAIAITLTVAVGVYAIVTWHVPTPLVPALGSLLPLFAKSPWQRRLLRFIAFLVILSFAFLGMASIGMLFLPGAMVMALATALTRE